MQSRAKVKQSKHNPSPPFHINELLSKIHEYVPLPVSLKGSYYPRGFNTWDSFVKTVHKFFEVLLKYDNNASVTFIGSSIQGYKFKKKDNNELWFNEKSDYDIMICSEKVFDRLSQKDAANNSTKKFHHVSRNSYNDEIISSLYNCTKEWHRPINIIVCKNLRDVVDGYILSLYIITNNDGNIVNTYLIGTDIIRKRKIGNKREFLSKYSNKS